MYTVVCVRDDDGWLIATVKEVPGVITQGKNVLQIKARIREALSLFVEDAESAVLVYEYPC